MSTTRATPRVLVTQTAPMVQATPATLLTVVVTMGPARTMMPTTTAMAAMPVTLTPEAILVAWMMIETQTVMVKQITTMRHAMRAMMIRAMVMASRMMSQATMMMVTKALATSARRGVEMKAMMRKATKTSLNHTQTKTIAAAAT